MAEPTPSPTPEPSRFERLKGFLARLKPTRTEKPVEIPLTQREIREKARLPYYLQKKTTEEQKRIVEQQRLNASRDAENARQLRQQSLAELKKQALEAKPQRIVEIKSGSLLDRVIGQRQQQVAPKPRPRVASVSRPIPSPIVQLAKGAVEKITSAIPKGQPPTFVQPARAPQAAIPDPIIRYDTNLGRVMVGSERVINELETKRRALSVDDAVRAASDKLGVTLRQLNQQGGTRDVKVARFNNYLRSVAGKDMNPERLARNIGEQMVRSGSLNPNDLDTFVANFKRTTSVYAGVKEAARELGSQMARGSEMPLTLKPRTQEMPKPTGEARRAAEAARENQRRTAVLTGAVDPTVTTPSRPPNPPAGTPRPPTTPSPALVDILQGRTIPNQRLAEPTGQTPLYKGAKVKVGSWVIDNKTRILKTNAGFQVVKVDGQGIPLSGAGNRKTFNTADEAFASVGRKAPMLGDTPVAVKPAVKTPYATPAATATAPTPKPAATTPAPAPASKGTAMPQGADVPPDIFGVGGTPSKGATAPPAARSGTGSTGRGQRILSAAGTTAMGLAGAGMAFSDAIAGETLDRNRAYGVEGFNTAKAANDFLNSLSPEERSDPKYSGLVDFVNRKFAEREAYVQQEVERVQRNVPTGGETLRTPMFMQDSGY